MDPYRICQLEVRIEADRIPVRILDYCFPDPEQSCTSRAF